MSVRWCKTAPGGRSSGRNSDNKDFLGWRGKSSRRVLANHVVSRIACRHYRALYHDCIRKELIAGQWPCHLLDNSKEETGDDRCMFSILNNVCGGLSLDWIPLTSCSVMSRASTNDVQFQNPCKFMTNSIDAIVSNTCSVSTISLYYVSCSLLFRAVWYQHPPALRLSS